MATHISRVGNRAGLDRAKERRPETLRKSTTGNSPIRALRRRNIVVFAGCVLTLAVICALFAPLLAPYDPDQQNLRSALQPPSTAHALGTDALGRDLLSRLIYGARVSLIVGVASVLLGAAAGMLAGLLSGYFGGWTDTLIMRVVDGMMSIPPIVLALAIGAALGGGLVSIVLSLGVALLPTYARVMRGQVLTVARADYVLSANTIGASHARIMRVHILPNCFSSIIVLATLNLGIAVLAEAGLSYLGLGVLPPTAAWGSMVNDGYKYVLNAPLLSIAPGSCIMLVVLAFNLMGDGVRDALDPRMRGDLA